MGILQFCALVLEFHFNSGPIAGPEIIQICNEVYIPIVTRAAVVPAKLVASVVKSACRFGSFRKAGRLAFVSWLQRVSSENFD